MKQFISYILIFNLLLPEAFGLTPLQPAKDVFISTLIEQTDPLLLEAVDSIRRANQRGEGDIKDISILARVATHGHSLFKSNRFYITMPNQQPLRASTVQNALNSIRIFQINPEAEIRSPSLAKSRAGTITVHIDRKGWIYVPSGMVDYLENSTSEIVQNSFWIYLAIAAILQRDYVNTGHLLAEDYEQLLAATEKTLLMGNSGSVSFSFAHLAVEANLAFDSSGTLTAPPSIPSERIDRMRNFAAPPTSISRKRAVLQLKQRDLSEFARQLFILEDEMTLSRDINESFSQFLIEFELRFLKSKNLLFDETLYLSVWFLRRVITRYPHKLSAIMKHTHGLSGTKRSVFVKAISHFTKDYPLANYFIILEKANPTHQRPVRNRAEIVQYLNLDIMDDYDIALEAQLDRLHDFEGAMKGYELEQVIKGGREFLPILYLARDGFYDLVQESVASGVFQLTTARPYSDRVLTNSKQRYLYDFIFRMLQDYITRHLILDHLREILNQSRVDSLQETTAMFLKVLRNFRFDDAAVAHFLDEEVHQLMLHSSRDGRMRTYIQSIVEMPIEGWELTNQATIQSDKRRFYFIQESKLERLAYLAA